MYYRLFDIQCQRVMATGHNSTTLKELIKNWLEYKSNDWDEETEKNYRNLNQKEIVELIVEDDFEIEKSKIPFEEEEW